MPFAQLVWSTTLTAGCGYAKDWETVVIVCRYQPMAILGKWKVMDLHVPKFAYKPGILPPQFQVTEKPEDLDESSSSGLLGQNTRETIIAEVLDYSWTDTPLD
ncbi:unnamed protein product [Allacma fusca]|uniref:Uncharacterized protein n=1 Tax=Allacma fusca TaxID=39272 RepID=A0A8J2J8A9_9HEXA|nr:unnamed protein product [Allacma fusca]